MLHQGGATTPFMKFGDHVRIEALDPAGVSIFGAIDQQVARASMPSISGD
jgi:fumarylacetoacetate (FAA) hydrolase